MNTNWGTCSDLETENGIRAYESAGLVYDYAKELSIDDESQRELFVEHDIMNMFVEVIKIEK